MSCNWEVMPSLIASWNRQINWQRQIVEVYQCSIPERSIQDKPISQEKLIHVLQLGKCTPGKNVLLEKYTPGKNVLLGKKYSSKKCTCWFITMDWEKSLKTDTFSRKWKCQRQVIQYQCWNQFHCHGKFMREDITQVAEGEK